MTSVDLSSPRSSLLAATLLASIACGPAPDPTPIAAPERPAAPTTPEPPPADPVVAPAPSTPSTPSTPPAPVAAPTPSGPLRAQDPGAYRPCEIAIETCTKAGKPCVDPHPCAINLVHVIPEGEPLFVSLTKPDTLRWRYAADERVLAGPLFVYKHTGPGKGLRSRADGHDESAVTFDKRGRLRQIGDKYRLDYTADGRTAGASALGRGGKWKQTVTFTWAADHTYKVNWTYPDADEFCEPEPTTVDVDAKGRVVRMVYADCQIDYSEFALNYHHDATGRLDAIDVECNAGSDNATSWHLALKYECPQPPDAAN